MTEQFKSAITGAATLLKPLLPEGFTVATTPAATRLVIEHKSGARLKAHPTRKDAATPEHLARTVLNYFGLPVPAEWFGENP